MFAHPYLVMLQVSWQFLVSLQSPLLVLQHIVIDLSVLCCLYCSRDCSWRLLTNLHAIPSVSIVSDSASGHQLLRLPLRMLLPVMVTSACKFGSALQMTMATRRLSILTTALSGVVPSHTLLKRPRWWHAWASREVCLPCCVACAVF